MVKSELKNRLIILRLILPFTIVFAVSLCVVIFLYLRADSSARAVLEVEAAKAMLTVIAGVLIGNIVLVIVRDYEERRKKMIKEQEGLRNRRQLLRTDLSEGVSSLYSKAKGLRRRLRAQISTDNHIQSEKYEEFLVEISDTQLGLERYKRQAENAARNEIVADSVPFALRRMEKYLGKLVTEYEQPRSSNERLILIDLPMLQDFIGRYSGSMFRSDFANPYRELVEVVATEIDK